MGHPKNRAKLLRLLCMVAVTLFAAGSYGAFEFTRPAWDSSSEMLRIARDKLGRKRVQLVAQLDWTQLKAEDGVLILHPARELFFTDISAFLEAGGRVALVDDYGAAAPLLERFRIQRIDGPSGALESFRNNPALPIARPHVAVRADGSTAAHPIVQGVDEVVTNHPTALRAEPGVELTQVLGFEVRGSESVTLAAVGVIGDARACGLEQETAVENARCGRLFAMADPSVFIDLMLRFEGNRKLLEGLLDYLLEDDTWGPRQGTLYIAANDFAESGHFGGPTDLPRALQNATEELRRSLAQVREQGLPHVLTLVLAAGLALAVCLWAFRSSGKPYIRYLPRYARAYPLVAQGGLAGRLSVLSAPSTQPALRLVELKSATEQHLRERLALPAHAGTQDILARLQEEPQGPLLVTRLRPLLTRMAEAERGMVGGESSRFSDPVVQDIHHQLREILDPLRTSRRPE